MIRFSVIPKLLASAACVIFMTAPGFAQAPKLIGEFNDWAAYTFSGKKGAVCYIVSQPKETSPKNVKRDPIHFLVTHRPSEKVRGEVNTIIGYPFKKGSTAKLTIDGSGFTLFTSGDGAWADTSNNDQRIVSAMKAGSKMVVEGVSWRGTKTVDRYSLSGVTAALDKIAGSCQ
ncbi:MAG: invasion associated locus B family protein [Aestuariivirgaceae bacterium]